MLELMQTSVMPIIEHLQNVGYVAAFIAAFIETTLGVGLLLPGSSFILLLGVFSASGGLNVWTLVFSAFAGAVLGDNLNYFFGRKYGTKWIRNGVWFVTPAILEKGRQFFDTHGGKSVFLGRFIPTVRETLPFIAGSVHMRRSEFVVWNALGALGWAMGWIFTGYLFAHSLELARLWMTRAGFAMVVVIVLFLLFYIIRSALLHRKMELLPLAKEEWLLLWYRLKGGAIITRLIREHPRIIGFVRARVSTSQFVGLPLTLFSLVLLYLIMLIVGVIESVVTSDAIALFDVRFAELVPQFRDATLTSYVWWVTLLGKSTVVLVFVVGVIALLWLWRKRIYIVPLLVTITGSVALAYLGKLFFQRPRPEWAMYLEHSYSFPSGHATVAMALYGFVTYVLMREMRSFKHKINVLFAGIIIIITIGISRLYLGVHYVSDVWEGYLLGLLWLVLGIALTEYLKHPSETFVRHIMHRLYDIYAQYRKPRKGAVWVSVAIIAIMVSWYIGYGVLHPLPIDL